MRYHWQICFPILLVLFVIWCCVFSHEEAFYFDEVSFVYSFLYVPCFRGHVREDVAAWKSEIFMPKFSSRTFMVLRFIFKSFIHFEFVLVME